MKPIICNSRWKARLGRAGWYLLIAGLLVPGRMWALGSWTTIAQPPPGNSKIQHMILLSDGSVMAQQAGTTSNWYRLTPVNGSYVNGNWTTMAPMKYTRQFY